MPHEEKDHPDVEACSESQHDDSEQGPTSAFQQLAILDRFLAVWIFLAMAVGIILGNFVPNTSKALERGKFVGVSVPIGTLLSAQCLRLKMKGCIPTAF